MDMNCILIKQEEESYLKENIVDLEPYLLY
jgi:hypothetical protein